MIPKKVIALTLGSLGTAHETLTNELLHCRQFILGPDFIDVLPGWRHINLDGGLNLSIHPELKVEQIAYADK